MGRSRDRSRRTRRRRPRGRPPRETGSEGRSETRTGAQRRFSLVLVALVLAVLCAAVYAPVRHHDFVNFDDHFYVLENERLHEGLTLEAVATDLTRPHHHNWIPLTLLSYRLDHAWGGLDAPPYLYTNVALHWLTSVVLFAWLCRATGATLRSAFVAAIFAAHPLHVESVAWVSERKDVLSGLFCMLAILAWVGYARRPSVWRYTLVFVLLVIGLLAKPMLVTLPIALLLIDYWPLARLGGLGGTGSRPWPEAVRRAVLEKLPLLAPALAVAVVAMVVQERSGALSDLARVDLPRRLANAAVSYGHYLVDAVWPAGLAALYPYPRGIETGPLALALVTFVACTVTVARLARRAPYLVTGWLWFLGTLVPVIGLIQVGIQSRADRYMYLPLLGPALIAVWGTADLLAGRQRRVLVAAGAAGGVAVLALAAVAHRQVETWRDTRTLFEHALAVTEGNWFAHVRLAHVHADAGEFRSAAHHVEEALRIGPQLPDPHFAAGDVAAARGDLEAAHAHYERGLALGPGEAAPWRAAGWLAERLGRTERAVSHYRRYVQLAPADLHVRNQLAWLLATSADPAVRDPGEAVALAEKLVGAPAYLDTRAAALAAAGRFDEAVHFAERALQGARAAGDTALAEQVRQHLSRFRAGRTLTE